MDILNEQFYLPPTLRQILNTRKREHSEDDSFFMRLFPMDKRVAIMNNYEASKFAIGHVADIHATLLNSRIVPTINKKLVHKITDNISIEGESDEDVSAIQDALINFRESISQATSYMLQRGEACITADKIKDDTIINDYTTLDKMIDSKIKFSIYPLARYDIEYDVLGRITDARLYKQLFDGKDKYSKHVLVEHRFKKNGIAYLEYNVILMQYNSSKWDEDIKKQSLEQRDLPKEIVDALTGIEINKPKEIVALGVYRIKNTDINSMCPNSDIGESQYLDIMDDVVSLDTSKTYREADKHIGRGRMMTPTLRNSMPQRILVQGNTAQKVNYQSTNSASSMLDYTFITPYDNGAGNPNAQPQAVQFDLRADSWVLDQNNLITEICTKCGLSVFDYNPSLVAGVRTAREVDELTDITASTISNKRSQMEYELKRMLNDICVMLGRTAKLFIKWDKTTTANAFSNNDLIIARYNAHLISKETAIKELYPNYNKEEIIAELGRINNDLDSADADVVFNNL